MDAMQRLRDAVAGGEKVWCDSKGLARSHDELLAAARAVCEAETRPCPGNDRVVEPAVAQAASGPTAEVGQPASAVSPTDPARELRAVKALLDGGYVLFVSDDDGSLCAKRGEGETVDVDASVEGDAVALCEKLNVEIPND